MTFHSPMAEWREKVASQLTTGCLKQWLQCPSVLEPFTPQVSDRYKLRAHACGTCLRLEDT